MRSFLVRAVGRLVIALACTYALLAIACIAVGWPLEMITTYMAIAAAGGGVALVVATIRHRRSQGEDEAQEMTEKPSPAHMAVLFMLGLLLVAAGLLLVAKHDVHGGSLLLIVGAGLILSYARSAARFAKPE